MRTTTRRSFLAALPALGAVALGAACAPSPAEPTPPPATGAPGGATPTSAPPTSTPRQSPIDVPLGQIARDPTLPELRVEYPPSIDLRVRYVSRDPARDPSGCGSRGREETVEADPPENAAALVLGDRRYVLRQFHFHTPSEHQVDGRRAPLEQHLVHAGPDGETLVVAVFLLGDGPGDTTVDRVLRRLPGECGEQVVVPAADLASMLAGDLSTVRYVGSLTTSPYTEPVSWLLATAPRRVGPASLAGLQGLFPDGDAREPQPLAGRPVVLREQRA